MDESGMLTILPIINIIVLIVLACLGVYFIIRSIIKKDRMKKEIIELRNELKERDEK